MSSTAARTRLFLVDDHQLFRSGLRAELEGEFDIVGEAGEVDQAVAGIAASRPDVVLLDVHLPGGGGATVADAVTRLGVEETDRKSTRLNSSH